MHSGGFDGGGSFDGGGGFSHCDGGVCHTSTDGGVFHSGGVHVPGDGGGFHFDTGTHTHGVPHHSDNGSFGYVPIFADTDSATSHSVPKSKNPPKPNSGSRMGMAIGAAVVGAVLAVDGWKRMVRQSQSSGDQSADNSWKWTGVVELAAGVGLLGVGLSL